MVSIKIIKLEKLFFVEDIGNLCQLPYPGHPKGCPNFGKCKDCPPFAPKLGDKYDLTKPCYFVVKPFDLAAQKAKMKKLHPDWSEKQCTCCLYWQNGVRSSLRFNTRGQADKLSSNTGWEQTYDFDLIPEAMGLDVFGTALEHGIPIERNPQNMVYKIAFVGVLIR